MAKADIRITNSKEMIKVLEDIVLRAHRSNDFKEAFNAYSDSLRTLIKVLTEAK